jgi:hypothetical protein
MLFDCSERPPKGDLAVSKALLMVILCCSSLTVYRDTIEHNEHADIRENEISDNSTILDNVVSLSLTKGVTTSIHSVLSNSDDINILNPIHHSSNEFTNMRSSSQSSSSSAHFSSTASTSSAHFSSTASTSSAHFSSTASTSYPTSSSSYMNNTNNSNNSNINLNENISWLISAKATELVVASLYMVVT